MRAVLAFAAIALLVPALLGPAAAEGLLYTFEGSVKMTRVMGLLTRCETTPTAPALMRLDIVSPLRANTGAENGVAILTVEGGRCEDSNETFLAKSRPGGWTFSDPALKGVGSMSIDSTGNGTYAASFALKNVTTEASAYTTLHAPHGVRLTVVPNV